MSGRGLISDLREAASARGERSFDSSVDSAMGHVYGAEPRGEAATARPGGDVGRLLDMADGEGLPADLLLAVAEATVSLLDGVTGGSAVPDGLLADLVAERMRTWLGMGCSMPAVTM